jgi:hypothetical protein
VAVLRCERLGDLTVPQSECFARGEAAIQRIGFGDVERTNIRASAPATTIPSRSGASRKRAWCCSLHPAGSAARRTRSSSIFSEGKQSAIRSHLTNSRIDGGLR